jgi:hypothetical protein
MGGESVASFLRLMPDLPENSNVPPPLPGLNPPLITAPPAPGPGRRGLSARRLLAILLSVCVGLYLADGLLSLADDSATLFFGLHVLGFFRGLVGFFALLVAFVVYLLMGITPLIPKRIFLPLTLSYLAAELFLVFMLIYFFERIQQVQWMVSLGQVILGLIFLYCLRNGFGLRWPLVSEDQLKGRGFSGWNLAGFVLANVFVLAPGVAIYLVFGVATAVHHFSEGFIALRPGGISVQVRKYVRGDGKTIQLFPMTHVADTGFFRKVAQSFPTNSFVLLEGVSDERNLLTNKINYKRMAASLGLGEQHEDFKPARGQMVRADIDVDQFHASTISLLNLVFLIHTKGVNNGTMLQLAQSTPSPDLLSQLLDDLLGLRNRHLMEQIQTRLGQSDYIIVPWGAAHMPGIAREIQKSGFHLEETSDYMAIRFRYFGHDRVSAH